MKMYSKCAQISEGSGFDHLRTSTSYYYYEYCLMGKVSQKSVQNSKRQSAVAVSSFRPV